MNIETAADYMRVALNEARYEVQSDRVRGIIDKALQDYERTQRQALRIRVCGHGACMALTDVLRGWVAIRDPGSCWHTVEVIDSAYHVRGLIADLRIRAYVEVAEECHALGDSLESQE